MRRIIGGAFLSLDGVMQAPGAPLEDTQGGFTHGGWWAPQFDDELGSKLGSWLGEPFDLLLGRRTYDIFAAHWPFIPAEDPVSATFNRINKYVLTTSQAPLEWAGSHRLSGIDALAALRNEEGPDLLIQGSSTLYPQLLAHGLLDRLNLMIGPLVLGEGKRLFCDGTPPGSLQLVDHMVTAKGVVIASYEPAGELQTGSFALGEPSVREIDRRRKMEGGDW